MKKWASFIILMSAVSCGQIETDLRSKPAKESAKKSTDKVVVNPADAKPIISSGEDSDKTAFTLHVRNKDAEFIRKEDETLLMRPNIFGARIIEADSEKQTVTMQFGYPKGYTVSAGTYMPKLSNVVLAATEENTLTSAGFKGEAEGYRINLRVEGKYCYTFFSSIEKNTGFYVRDFDCNLIVLE